MSQTQNAIHSDTALGQRLREESGEFWSATTHDDGSITWHQIPDTRVEHHYGYGQSMTVHCVQPWGTMLVAHSPWYTGQEVEAGWTRMNGYMILNAPRVLALPAGEPVRCPSMRVHETDGEATVAFNLDDLAQVDRYVRTLAANAGTRLLTAGSCPLCTTAGHFTYRATLLSQTRGNVEVLAGPESEHAHDCYTCYCAFDRHAGNATAPFATAY